ncbi:stalk domain-containing protein [Paenibacillus provencensis]|uniref:Stalk domain-containing protein n=1 Tax=Paenibacillus provencensis TaxID=441151 RepID=A0ABW3PXE8_9BACL
MKKKVVASLMVASMMVGGVVSAASMWGTYKGNEIVRVQLNGSTVKYKDVPAISYDGRTMIPVSMLRDLGVSYTWDQANKTIKLQKTNTVSSINSNNTGNTNPSTVTMTASDLKLYSNDGKVFLGTLSTNFYDSESIFNEYGDYGSEYSATSITNEFGTYGGEYSNESAYNDFATKPPMLTYKGQFLYYVTTNEYMSNSITPQELYGLAKSL